MADSVSIGELVIRIGADAKALQTGLKAGEKGLKDFGDRGAKTAGGIENSMARMRQAFLALGFGALIKSANNSTLELGKLADASGIAVTALSRLKEVAEDNTVSFDSLRDTINHYSMQVADAGSNPTSRFAQALAQLGVSARKTNGEFKNFDEILPELIERMNRFRDGAGKSAIATDLMGRRWKEIAPIFKLTGGALEEAKRQVEAKLIVDAEAVKQAKIFAQQINDLKDQIEALSRAFINIVAGPLSGLVSQLKLGIDSIGKLAEAAKIELLSRELKQLTTSAVQLGKELSTGLDTVGDSGMKASEEYKIVRDRIKEVQAELEKLTEQQELSGRQVNPIIDPRENLDPEKFVKMKAELDTFLNRLQGLPVLMGEAFAFDERPFAEALQRLEALKDKAVMTDQQRAAIKLGLQKAEQDQILNTASLAASTLTAVFGKSKLAAIASAIINTAVGVTKALSDSPPPFNFINAGLVAAAGAAQLAAIRSTSESGGGAAPSAPSSSSVPAVQRQAPGDGSGGGGRVGNGQNVTLQINGSNFSRESVRDLVRQVGDYMKDGGKLVFAT